MTEPQRTSALWKVLGLYLAGAWVALQVIDVLADNIGLPSWVFVSALVLFVIGLPVVGLTSYAHNRPAARGGEISPRSAAGRAQRLFTWRNALFTGLTAFALWGLVSAGWLALRGLGPSRGTADLGQSGGEVSTGSISISTSPPGAAIRLSRVVDEVAGVVGDPLELGPSPVEKQEVSAGEYLVEIVRDGTNRLVLLAAVENDEESRMAARLVTDDGSTADMVFVPAGAGPVGLGGTPVREFLIDRHEVTNEDFARFIGDGGYEASSLWPDSLLLASTVVSRTQAIARLTDRSGATGPRGWSGSLYPAGTGEHPVTGVSWYEANAYCLWAGKRLPATEEWWRAALGSGEGAFPWGAAVERIESRAAFNRDSSWPAGSAPLGVSPFGAYDMAGNAREWLLPEVEDAAMVSSVGGSWQAPEYTFGVDWQEKLPPGFADETTGFRCVRHTE